MKSTLKTLKTIINTVLMLFLWEIMSLITKKPSIPSIFSVLRSFFDEISSKTFYLNFFSTLKIVLIGLVISLAISFVLVVISSTIGFTNSFINQFVNVFRNIPSIALFPIIIAILGIKDQSRILIIVLMSVPPIYISTMFGLKNVDEQIVQASSLETGKVGIFWHIKMPIALPDMLNGFKIGTGSSFVAIVVAEMLGASKGLGYMVLWCTNAFQYQRAYAYIIAIVILGCIFNFLIEMLIKNVKRRLYG